MWTTVLRCILGWWGVGGGKDTPKVLHLGCGSYPQSKIELAVREFLAA